MITQNSNLQVALVVYAVATVVLLLAVKFSNFYAADMSDHPAEDAVLGKLPPVPEDIKRRKRIIANNNENVPIELAVFWAAFISVLVQSVGGGGKEEALALTVLVAVYAAARVAFVAAYALALQPARTIAFAVAMSSTVAAAGVLLASASKAYVM